MKKIYKKPITELVNVGTSVETMAGFEATISNVEVDDEAAKEHGVVEEEEVAPATPNLWGDIEEGE